MIQRNRTFAEPIRNTSILVAPHLGRDGEFCGEFVSLANPLVAVFSDGTRKHQTQAYSLMRYANKTRGVIWIGSVRFAICLYTKVAFCHKSATTRYKKSSKIAEFTAKK